MTSTNLPPRKKPSLLFFFLKPVYHLLYHSFAWTYDWAAALVSLNRWNEWIRFLLPEISGSQILELGFGPGHLQKYLWERGDRPFGIDESPQMARITRNRLRKRWSSKRQFDNGYTHYCRLVRGLSQNLPFPDEYFSTVASTFPAPFIFSPDTLREAYRVLAPGGRLVILLTAWYTQNIWYGRWILRIFPFARIPPEGYAHIRKHFQDTPFQVEIHEIPYRSSAILVIFARKGSHPVSARDIDRDPQSILLDEGNSRKG